MNLNKLENETEYEYGVIYMVRNNINGKIYFGQTVRSFKRRYSTGIENTTNLHLSNSIKKYGIENFTIVEEFDKATSSKELNDLEEMYIKMWDTINPANGYNKKHGGDNKKYSEESKKKISDSLKELYKTKVHAGNKKIICLTTGEVFNSITEAKKQLSMTDINLSTIEKPIASGKKDGKYLEWYDYNYYLENKNKLIIGNNLKEHSRSGKNNSMYGVSPKERMDEETYKKWKSKLGRKGKDNPTFKGNVMGISLDGNKAIVLKTAMQGKKFGFDNSEISKCCKGKRLQHKGYKWKYINIPK